MDPRDTMLGARWRPSLPPGVYERVVASPAPPRDVRMDVAAFIGLSERGPVGAPVSVDSWSEFTTWFGSPGGGRLLPDCVRLFFANGGRRAVVVRVVDYREAITARFRFDDVGDDILAPLELEARDPGAWGDRLRLEWQWVRGRTLSLTPLTPTRLHRSPSQAIATGTLLRRVRRRPGPGGQGLVEADLTYVTTVEAGEVGVDPPLPLLAVKEVAGPMEEVRASLRVTLGEEVQRIVAAALHPDHEESLQRRLTDNPRSLVRIVASQVQRPVWPIGTLLGGTDWARAGVAVLLRPGEDAADTTAREHFFAAPARGKMLDHDHIFRNLPAPWAALHAYDDTHETEPVSLICLPDLLHPQPASAAAKPDAALDTGTRFMPCDVPAAVVAEAVASHAYPFLAQFPNEVVTWQQELVKLCAGGRPGAGYGRVAVLDLPPAYSADAIVRWRLKVTAESGHSAAYAPWLECVPSDDLDGQLLVVPPCGVACGVIARQERLAGVHFAPANAGVTGIVGLHADPLLPDPGFLHEERVNLIRATEAGVKVMGARTTSFTGEWTHLSVRRLLHYLCRQLELDTRWAMFEPHDLVLWRRLTLTVERRLAALFNAGAFAGATPSESWFVRCDATVNTSPVQDAGQVIALVGVAPAVPAEFLVFRLVLQRDGASLMEELRG